ncbi:SDR family NAD(P)-dependent oxidoreductase [Antarctobacter sp.]|uniref:SDR family NAD(P)-dependent oxidoreductase n=1 Tax=Antarctobacter sp. TaxID=1872577 RepID=UPI003A94E006
MTAFRNAFGLADTVCVVTGGAGGIGRGCALALAGDGARVAVLDRDAEGADETATMIRDAGGQALAVACDTSDRASIEAAHDRVVKAFGTVGVLVNNAGIAGRGDLMEVDDSDWDRVVSVNLTGYHRCAQIFGRGMIRRGGGAMVHMSSINAIAPVPGSGSYAIAKAGVSAMSHQLAAELGPHGVRSNAVLPGLIRTGMGRASYEDSEIARARDAIVPLGRVGVPDDIAQVVLFLASPRASYVSGAEILVDGAFRDGLMRALPRAKTLRA